jgi:threonyl-tRNA synthetase
MASDPIRATLPDGKVLELPKAPRRTTRPRPSAPDWQRRPSPPWWTTSWWTSTAPSRSECALRLLTERDPDALPLLRHSAAHVLATAVRRVRPGAEIGFGPAIEEGFYYDFGVEAPFTPEDLERFEAEIQAVIEADYPFERKVVDKAEARELFHDDPLKLERLEEFGDDETITVYRDGPFLDLCRGPHVPSTGRLQHVKLLSAAGAYWRGDERRQMLQRIYGTAFFKEKELADHLERLEEAKKRDHRVLGKQLDLFTVDARVGSGLILWQPAGAIDPERDRGLREGAHPSPRLRARLHPPRRERAPLRDLGAPGELPENMFGAMEVEGARYRPSR